MRRSVTIKVLDICRWVQIVMIVIPISYLLKCIYSRKKHIMAERARKNQVDKMIHGFHLGSFQVIQYCSVDS